MGDREEAARLVAAARNDVRALAGMADPGTFAEEIFGFHAQQAAEKALKARLALAGVEYPRTHDLSLLLSLLEECGAPVPGSASLVEYNPYAVQFRYGGAFSDMGAPLDRPAVVRQMVDLVDSTERLVGGVA